MRKNLSLLVACAAAGVASSITSFAHAGTFLDNFNNNNVNNPSVSPTDVGTPYWSTGNYSPGDAGFSTETNSLTIGYNSGTGQGGGFLYTTTQSQDWNYFTQPSTYTLTAAGPNGNLIPGTEYDANNLAETYLGVDGNPAVYRLDTGTNRSYVQLSNQNVPMLVIKDNGNTTTYNFGQFGLPSGANILVKSMFLYLDGTDEIHDHLYVNFGETFVNTNDNTTTSTSMEQKLGLSRAFDLGVISPANHGGFNLPQASLDAVKAGFANGASPGLEVLNFASNFNGFESVAMSSFTNMANLVWNNTGAIIPGDGATWDFTNQNWDNGSATNVYTEAAHINFTDNNSGHYAVALNSTVNPSSVLVNASSGNYSITGTGTIGGTGALTKQGTSTLTLGTTNTYTGGTTVTAGTLIVGKTGALGNGALSIASSTVQLGTSTGLAKMTSLSITSGGVLDINNNHAVLSYTGATPMSSVLTSVASGYAAGAWNGAGINSSAAAVNAGYGVGVVDGGDGVSGASVASGTIEIAYALYGDINLDGVVNGTDFSIFAQNFGKTTNLGWEQGDFDYGGTVNGSDFSKFAQNFGKSASGNAVALSSSDWTALDSFASANGLSLTSVPEPASIGLLVAGSIGLASRRRRSAR